MKFDIVSDLHIENWQDYPYDWLENKINDNVIIAGDIADDIDLTIQELKKACCVYTNVLYVDGNHESTNNYDNLEYANERINNEMIGLSNFYNLSNRDFFTDNGTTVIIGRCGWWDFKMCEPYVSCDECIHNFDMSWCIQNLTKEQVVYNIVEKANKDYEYLRDKVDKYTKQYYDICVVTHTVPIKELMSDDYPMDRRFAGHYGNSKIGEIVMNDNVKTCIFGHNHDAKQLVKKFNKTFINNARGRKNDFNRIHYKPLEIEL